MIEIDLYKSIIKCLPIVCVDIIVKNSNGQFLLVKRKNNPLEGEWWVIGGRIEHMEKAENAAKRKLKEEVNLNIDNLLFENVYEDTFENNAFEKAPYHTVSLVFSCVIIDFKGIKLDEQSSDWIWSDQLPNRFVKNRI